MEETTFKDLGINCIVNIFSRLTPKECAQAACVAHLWQHVSAEDSVWKPHLLHDFASSSCSSPDGSGAASFKAAYVAWHQAYADVAGPLLSRSLAAWSRIKAWLQVHSPRILGSLNPGASAEDVGQLEAALGHPLPMAVRCIYRVHNGQQLVVDQREEEGPPPDLLMGLFGCVAFYDHVTSNQMLPLDKAVKLTKLLRSMRPLGAGQTMLSSSEVIFAHSFRAPDKLCAVDCTTGAVLLKLAHRDWPMAPAQDSSPLAFDGLLRWFEEYSWRLSSGVYGTCQGEACVADMGLHEGQAISLFPRAHPYAATAITRGVKVTWSSVLVPQESRQGRLMFAYSVRFSLLTQQQQQAALAQLAAEQATWQQRQQQLLQVNSPTPTPTKPNNTNPDPHITNSKTIQAQILPAETAAAAAAPSAGAAAAEAASSRDVSGTTAQQHSDAIDSALDIALFGYLAASLGGQRTAAPTPHRRQPGGSAAARAQWQGIVLGPCSAAAGPAAVPTALATDASWQAAAAAGGLAAACGSNGGSSAGDALPGGAPGLAAAGSSGGGSSGGNGRTSTPGTAAAAAAAEASDASVPSSCQLESRHWVVLNAQGSHIDSVDGEGVVGLYPLLCPGGEPYAYASCTPCPIPDMSRSETAPQGQEEAGEAAAAAGSAGSSTQGLAGSLAQQGLGQQQVGRWETGPGKLAGCVVGAMEGSFGFVEGSLLQRSGAFTVKCPRLVFAVPEYIF